MPDDNIDMTRALTALIRKPRAAKPVMPAAAPEKIPYPDPVMPAARPKNFRYPDPINLANIQNDFRKGVRVAKNRTVQLREPNTGRIGNNAFGVLVRSTIAENNFRGGAINDANQFRDFIAGKMPESLKAIELARASIPLYEGHDSPLDKDGNLTPAAACVIKHIDIPDEKLLSVLPSLKNNLLYTKRIRSSRRQILAAFMERTDLYTLNAFELATKFICKPNEPSATVADAKDTKSKEAPKTTLKPQQRLTMIAAVTGTETPEAAGLFAMMIKSIQARLAEAAEATPPKPAAAKPPKPGPS